MIHGCIHDERDRILLSHVSRTSSVWDRMRGLLGRAPLEDGQGLLIDPCASVHTFFMRYAIDLVYLDRQWFVNKLVKEVRPWRLSACQSASMTLELAAGQIEHMDLKVGSQMIWKEK